MNTMKFPQTGPIKTTALLTLTTDYLGFHGGFRLGLMHEDVPRPQQLRGFEAVLLRPSPNLL